MIISTFDQLAPQGGGALLQPANPAHNKHKFLLNFYLHHLFKPTILIGFKNMHRLIFNYYFFMYLITKVERLT